MCWRVLVVDDDVELLSLLKAAAADAAVAFDTASDGEVALRLYGLARQSEHPYDGVVLDGVMPGLSGYNIATYIRERDTHTPLAFCTAHVNNLWRHWAQELNVTAFWEKPVQPDELIRCIANWLEHSKVTVSAVT